MSDCGNYDCADKTKCVKKGTSYGLDIIETDKSFVDVTVMEVSAEAEHGGKCKCGASCACVDCKCGQ